MRRFLISIFVCLTAVMCSAQEYTVRSAGQGNSGSYLVEVTVSSKKKLTSTAEDVVKEYAVRGVLFRGLMASSGYGEQKPLIKDPNVEQTKSSFFKAFFNEGAYKKYASIVGSSLSTMKNKQTKMQETSATVMVDKESLQHYLEESGIIQGFSNLW